MLTQFKKQVVANSKALTRFALQQPKMGWIDEIVNECFICGWAYEPRLPPSKLSLEYRGTVYQTITADAREYSFRREQCGASDYHREATLPQCSCSESKSARRIGLARRLRGRL
jgi:hypothetical protein